MENKEYCKAVINRKMPKMYIVFLALALLSILVYVLTLIPVKTVSEPLYAYVYTSTNGYKRVENGSYSITSYNVYGQSLTTKEYSSEGKLVKIDNSDLELRKHFGWNTYTTAPVYVIAGLFVIFLITANIKSRSKKCYLELNQDGVLGKKKKLLSLESLNLPFEKIDSIYVKDGIFDKLLGGKTIAVNSSSSRVRFLCIDNAQEFTDKTLEKLKEYKESVSKNNPVTASESNTDAMDSMLKLKQLLDQGLITQEEFDEKRKSFIEKI